MTYSRGPTMRVALLALLVVVPAAAQTFDSGSTGALGALAPSADTVVDLPEDGVLHYTTVSIPAGVTVTFKRNAANTPVYLLASGDVTVEGTIDVSGHQGGAEYFRWWISKTGGLGGPGGDDGGASRIGLGTNWGQSGQGPGGGQGYQGTSDPWGSGGGGGASPVADGGKKPAGASGKGGTASGDKTWWIYHGGGGGGTMSEGGGGGGGGVITIACSGTLTVNGAILANGGPGNFHGAGGGAGSIRLVATTVMGSGTMSALTGGVCSNSYSNNGACGGAGIIRVDGYTILGTLITKTNPAPYYGTPTLAVPYPATKRPTLRLVSHDGAGFAFSDPNQHGMTSPPNMLPQAATVSIVVEATWVPPGTPVTIAINTVGAGRALYSATLAGTLALSTATVDVTVPAGKQAGTVEAWIASLPLPVQ